MSSFSASSFVSKWLGNSADTAASVAATVPVPEPTPVAPIKPSAVLKQIDAKQAENEAKIADLQAQLAAAQAVTPVAPAAHINVPSTPAAPDTIAYARHPEADSDPSVVHARWAESTSELTLRAACSIYLAAVAGGYRKSGRGWTLQHPSDQRLYIETNLPHWARISGLAREGSGIGSKIVMGNSLIAMLNDPAHRLWADWGISRDAASDLYTGSENTRSLWDRCHTEGQPERKANPHRSSKTVTKPAVPPYVTAESLPVKVVPAVTTLHDAAKTAIPAAHKPGNLLGHDIEITEAASETVRASTAMLDGMTPPRNRAEASQLVTQIEAQIASFGSLVSALETSIETIKRHHTELTAVRAMIAESMAAMPEPTPEAVTPINAQIASIAASLAQAGMSPEQIGRTLAAMTAANAS